MSCRVLDEKYYGDVYSQLAILAGIVEYSECTAPVKIAKNLAQDWLNLDDYKCRQQRLGTVTMLAAIKKLVPQLARYNLAAYDERYGCEPDNLSDKLYLLAVADNCQKRNCDLNAVQLLKSLQSINYQCIDSESYRNSELKNTVTIIIKSIALSIIENCAEYQAAQWP